MLQSLSKMASLRVGLLGLFIWISLAQIENTQAQECSIITSISSPSASSLLIQWSSYPGATNYILDLRVVNVNNVAPVVVTVPAQTTQREVFGLKPGTLYTVVVKVFHFYRVDCADTRTARTVPDTSQLTYWRAISSTAISLEWEKVATVDQYFLVVNSTLAGVRYNLSFTSTSAQIQNLRPVTSYDCYVVTSNSAGLGARSRVRTVTTLVQPPPVVTAEHTTGQTVQIRWQPVDKVLLYRVMVLDSGGAQLVSTTVSTTFLDVQNMLPCSTYQIRVSSMNTFLEPGEWNQISYTTNTLGSVTSVSVDYFCHSGSATVYWGTVFGATSYEAVAVDQSGRTVSCTSTNTMCLLNSLSCGGDYTVQVSAFANGCESMGNAITYFQTVPCAPANLQLFRECSSNVIIFTWGATNNTMFYMANAVDSANVSQDCITTDTSCFFTNTVCGRNYNFTVYAKSGECDSGVSTPVHIQTAPCKPTNMVTVSDCQSDMLTSLWDKAAGALRYTVTARGNRGNTSISNYYTCNSTTTNCVIPDVGCGESLTMRVTSYDDECSSESTLGLEAVTVPCVPQNVSAIMDCSSDSVTLTWLMAYGALFYVAAVTDSSGRSYTCNTMDLNCQVTGLRCGTTYSASVLSSNYKCNSSASTSIQVETAPCPPSQVQAALDCAGNQAQVSWMGLNPPASYTASLEDQSGALLSCSTVTNSCWVPSLKCGQIYDVSVTYHNGVCRSRPSPPVQMKSVPCGPGNFQAQVYCDTGVLQMTWDQTKGADGYSASVVSVSDGGQQFCNSTSPTCSLSSLTCGDSYVTQVRSYNGSCFSMSSLLVTVKEVPCVPTNVRVESTCGSSTTVTWQPSRGAQSYRVVAVGNRGHQTECSSNSTTCSLTDLLCDQVYSINVMGLDEACTSPRSQTVTLRTAPCAPVNVHGVMECRNNSVTLSWDLSPNAVTYTISAKGTDGHIVGCNSSAAGCQITELHCGHDYKIRVTASDGVCVSPDSQIYVQTTAPCAPSAVSNTLNCDNTLGVSWAPGNTPLNYSVLASPGIGAVLGCTSPNTGCDITGLQCGQSYAVTVTATNRVCTGQQSTSQIIQTGPCMPVSVRASVMCASNTVSASWASAAGALSYTSVLTSPSGSTQSCSTSGLYCNFSNLTCAQNYTVRVLASDGHCNSTVSQNVTVTTAPCDPDSVGAELQCSSGQVQVLWQASAGASAYTVLAYTQNQGIPSSSCVSTSTSCSLTQLQCGTVFNVTVLASDGICNSTSRSITSVKSVPCSPVLQAPPLSCISDQAVMSWTRDQDALGVTVNASSPLGHAVQCNSTDQNCTLNGLQCGQTYTVQGTTKGLRCDSTPSAPLSIVTVPCTPATVRVNYTCETNTAVLSWNESLGRESFTAWVQTQNHSDSCSSNQTHCSLSSLLCGRAYNVSVKATAGTCSSTDVARTQMLTAPCAPQNVSATLQCANNTASVSWTESAGATSYNVTAVSSRSDTKYCRTSQTTCQLPNMQCAETYNIVVKPFSETCNGVQSSVFVFTAGPCPPSGVQVSLQCETNIGSVSWPAVPNAETYLATARSPDGQTSNCTTNSTGCSFQDLQCGRDYSVTVVTMERGCWSQPSTPVILKSAICPPANLTGLTQCGTNDITVTWDPSPRTGVSYFLFSQQDGGANATYITSLTSQTLSGLQCGWIFTVSVAAKDNSCTSHYSSPVQLRTAPCSPSGLAATTECGMSLGNLSWSGGAGALFYTTTLVSDEGHTASCTSSTFYCVVKLECSQHYTATVIASTDSCNSTANSSIEFNSAPCLVSNLQTQLNCTTNTLDVQWAAISGKPKSYTALAIGTDGTRPFCNTSSTSCTIQGLQCGRTYGIAVLASTIQCNVQGSDYQVQTAPCKPNNSSVSLECRTNIATVEWKTSAVNQTYRVSAVNSTGGITECVSTGSSCIFNQFGCGETYTVTVTGVTQQCSSQPSNTMDLNTAPCIPTQVEAKYDCDTSITTVQWDISRSAESYTVYASGNRGHKANCSSTDTSCDFPDLQCGQDYNITVIAERGGCRNLASQPITVSTGPCPHSDPRVLLDCSRNSALISWMPGDGILFYNASAESLDVGDRVKCGTNGTSCNLTGLQCAQLYQISVSGQGYVCPSSAQDWVHLTTGPCPPNQVSARALCDVNTVTVSWMTSQGSLSYLAVAQGSSGQMFTCRSNGTTCDIMGLQCGQTYEVHVSGVDGTCIGPKSQVQLVKTAPCIPQNVQTSLECQSTVLNITWQQTGDATRYLARVETSGGQVISRDTDKLFLTVPNIVCGLTYNVTMVAQNEKCNSSRSSVQRAISAPCPPQTISAVLDCVSNTISVNWSSSVPGVSYVAQAVSSNRYYTCNTTDNHCSMQVPCAMTYNISVVPVRNGCTGANSASKIIQSAPCVPTLTSVEMDCLSDSAWVIWEVSAGAESYTAVARGIDGRQYDCTSSDSSCAVLGLQCGNRYNFSVIASNQECNSTVSNIKQSETAPCAPEGVNVSVGCDSGTVSVRWLDSVGALTYTTTLERTDGQTSCCSPLPGTTFCNVTSLPCGQMYVVTVTAGGQTCNSSQSIATTIQTAPCQPQGLNASVSCTDNTASVWWNSSVGAQLYTVNAVSQNGAHTDTCDGFDGSCELSSLTCGLEYMATVTARHSTCVSLPSPSIRLTTVPCQPQNVTLELDCHARNLSVSWDRGSGVEFYTATLQDSIGRSTNCQSLSDRCTISGLACGNIYHASVVASDSYCSSQPSDIKSTDSVPCAPGNIQAQMDVQTGTAVLSWQMSPGAVGYKVMAESSSGHNVSCESNQTNCELLRMVCGSKYNVTVQAVGRVCSSSASMHGYLVTGPCVPEQVSVSYASPVALVQWDVSRGAVNYTVLAVSQQGLQTSCSSQDTSCALNSLNCSQMYNITVRAYNGVYQEGVSSTTYTLQTEPCPPGGVTGQAVGSQGDVSWEPSIGAVSYVAVLEGGRGDTLFCQTTETSCNVSVLQCGTMYLIQVSAIGASLNSSASEGALLTSVPCLPDPGSFVVAMQCENDSALISWAWSDGATSYQLTATDNNGYQKMCSTNQTSCQIRNLECGQSYNLSITAINKAGAVTQDTGVTFQSRPCMPRRVGVNLECGTRMAVLTWEQTLGVFYYQASATFRPGEAATVCNSSTDSCRFSELQCGVEYSFRIRAYNAQCSSEPSSSVYIKTEPCQPQNLTVSGTCEANMLRLNWTAAAGALLYTVSATGNLGYISSVQTNTSAMQMDVPCGQSYTFTVKSQNEGCNSPPSTPAKFSTAPCVPMNVQTYIQCEDSMGSVSWAVSDGATSYTAVAQAETLGHARTCSTNGTACTWTDLSCGEIYTVRVIANNLQCSSAPSTATTIHTAPCIPRIMNSSMDCNLRVASLTWQSSRAAQFYLVNVQNNIGHQVALTTNSTSTQISELQCGQQYYLTVVSVGHWCRSVPSNASVLQTDPCPPSVVSASVDCYSNIAVVSWTLSNTADHYTAKATGPGGTSQTCMSSNTSCGIATLQCGQKYNITVTASRLMCSSAPSQLTYLNTAPCVPMGMSVAMDCSKNEARVSWGSSSGALFYRALASSKNNSINCDTSGFQTSCILGNLTCGAAYTVQVMAIGNECSSLLSQPVEFHSVPCRPSLGSVQLNCDSRLFSVNWNTSEGVTSYTAAATASGGQMSYCITNLNSCQLTQLTCGQAYNITLAASNGVCSSKLSIALQAVSVPCRPMSVVPKINCQANSAHVHWDPSGGAESYQVRALGTKGHMTGCNTTSTFCDVPNLQCGDVYNVSVVALSNKCSVTGNLVTPLSSVPCAPVPLSPTLDCASGAVTTSWQSSTGATSYTVLAQDATGSLTSCNSTSTTCVFSKLQCGLTYSFSISAADANCSSANSPSVQLDTVPCQPQKVSAQMDCGSATGLVSWESRQGVSSYLVQAVGADGHQTQCSSTTTNCSLPSMNCGKLYSLAAVAQDGRCNSSSTRLNLQSVPCKPMAVQATPLCSSRSALVTWQNATGALRYQVEAVSKDGLYNSSCNSSSLSCNLERLVCGTSYNVSVVALDDTCRSVRSIFNQNLSAPCSPQNVKVQMSCSNGAMTVTWAANPDAEFFHVEAMTNNGSSLSCNSTSTSCSIGGLPCGSSYSVTVRAARGSCQSEPSTAVPVMSAPCVPQGESGNLDCVTNSVWVSWQQTSGAESYQVLAVTAGGGNYTCNSTNLFCNLANLRCGAQYTVHVTALNSWCASAPSNTFQIRTGPCALTGISASTECRSSSINVTWLTESSSVFHVATAEGQDQSFLECNGTSTSCVLSGARCGMQYSVMVSASSDKCNSLRSPPYFISTDPCAPQNVSVKPLCDTKEVLVSWAGSTLTQSYSLTATGQDGDVRNCSGSANNCTLSGLRCGQPYTLSVIATAGNCTSPASLPVTFRTAPCVPKVLDVSVSCSNSSAKLLWSSSEGSLRYYASARTSQGSELHCDTADTSCNIAGLQCGLVYNFSVQASDGTCNSSLGQPLRKGAAPCPPASVTVRHHAMGNNTLVRVYWSAVTCPAVNYLAELTGQFNSDPSALIQVASYWTERTYFEFPVPCDLRYSVVVRAGNQEVSGAPSSAVNGSTVPCPVPATNNTGLVSGRRRRDLQEAEILDRVNDTRNVLPVPEVKVVQVKGVTLRVEWVPVTGATAYTLTVKEHSPSHPIELVLTGQGEFLEVPDLKPGTRYCVTLSAESSVTQSANSQAVCTTTEAPM